MATVAATPKVTQTRLIHFRSFDLSFLGGVTGSLFLKANPSMAHGVSALPKRPRRYSSLHHTTIDRSVSASLTFALRAGWDGAP